MKSNYSEKKEARIRRLRELASKAGQQSDSLFEKSSKMASAIPFGQPILVGHHSEQRDRNYRARIASTMDKAVETSHKADYYAEKAQSAEANNAISSDNPEAIALLEEKLQKLQQAQETYKAVNKIVRSKLAEAEKIDRIKALGLQESTARKLLAEGGIHSWQISNNGAVIRNVKERIEQLRKIETLPESSETINGVTLEVSPSDNRVKIIFPSIPSEETRSKLKHGGFHWSRYEGAWMRQISNHAVWMAKQILNALPPAES